MEFASTCVPQRILAHKDFPLFPKGTRDIASIVRAVGYASRSLQEGEKNCLPDVHASGREDS